ncbi:MAG: GNAT family N-acetyltransferase [Reichenbachiella sp.]|uniref:GNAT family N-acetyltransferase n=1 Tax=Reichenbachiella sp. TaxID=2184521 RepID=UPI003296B23A
MDSFDFLTEIPALSESGNIPVYYTKKYLSQHESDLSSFCAIDRTTKQLNCAIHFQISGKKATSLISAPFGGIYFYQTTNNTPIDKFLNYVIDQLKKMGISQIMIKSAPPFYGLNNFDEASIFYDKHFSIHSTDINHHIDINQSALIDHISPMQKRRLKKCMTSHFLFKKEKESDLDRIFKFISTCRKDRNHTLSMSFDQIQSAFDLLPDQYLIFSCYHNGILAGATICVIVNEKVMYNFLPASAKSFDSYSPMVFLISNIYQYCQEQQFEVLDLGTSMLNNEANKKLIAFKERMGGVQTERFCYQMNL